MNLHCSTVKLLTTALCIILCIFLELYSNVDREGTDVVVVDAFSYHPVIPTRRSRPIIAAPSSRAREYIMGRGRCSTDERKVTQLHEQPVNRKEILGPISPSTLVKYNLPPEVIAEGGWSAQLVSRAATTVDNQSRESDRVLGKVKTEIELIPRNPKEHYAGIVRVSVPIPLDEPAGLGIELLELEGGRDDGLGITIVTGLVPDGNSAKAVASSRELGEDDGETIMYGDTIVSAELVMQLRGTSATTDIRSIKTECLGYDATVDALVGMMSFLDNDNIQDASVVLSLKRLRRRPNLTVKLHYPPEQDLPSETLQLQSGDNLRMVLLQRGIKLNDPLAQRYDGKSSNSGNCGGGSLCRTCAVNVLRGGELLSKPKENEKKMTDDNPRWRLACKSWVGYGMNEGEIVIQVNPRQW
mmetsp:Transcript_9035/g.22052  ORF Transcript_9035/g.22052 Transcript_9035/m.22052 type:complete len:413 (+) Transcript_9035:251-1489(+)